MIFYNMKGQNIRLKVIFENKFINKKVRLGKIYKYQQSHENKKEWILLLI